jgi:hypothetical protein
MTLKRESSTATHAPDTSPAIRRPPSAVRRIRIVVAVSAAVVVAGGIAIGVNSGAASAATQLNCSAVPHSCGYPDATNSGVPSGVALQTVPGQVSSGLGWRFDPVSGTVKVTGQGAVLSGLYIPYNLDISASGVLVQNVQVVTDGNFGVSLRHVSGVTIQNSTINGQNATTGRVSAAITDVYGDSTGTTVKNDNISYFKTAVQLSTGLVTGNYIHNPGYISGDHTNGIFDVGTTQPLTISGNTILMNLGQTDAISLNASVAGQPVANKTVSNNLIGGGSYSIYGGASLGNTTSNIVIQSNRFSQQYYPQSGRYGPVAWFNPREPGNVWNGNVWSGNVRSGPAQAHTIAPPSLLGRGAPTAGAPAAAGHLRGKRRP